MSERRNLEKRRFNRRVDKIETEIKMSEDLNREFAPRQPRKLKPTRWEFNSLHKENVHINRMARKAFDPMSSFIEGPKAIEHDEICHPSISTPHRIGHYFGSIDSRYNSAYRIGQSGSYFGMSDGSLAFSTRGRGSLSGKTDLDAPIDQFVDNIQDYRRW